MPLARRPRTPQHVSADRCLEGNAKRTHGYLVEFFMLKLITEQPDWLAEQIPDPPWSPKRGRPPTDKRKIPAGTFRIQRQRGPVVGAVAAVRHRENGRPVVRLVDARRHLRADRAEHERARVRARRLQARRVLHRRKLAQGQGRRRRAGVDQSGKSVRILLLLGAKGLPVAVDGAPAHIHQSRRAQRMLGIMLPAGKLRHVIGDKVYNNDASDEAPAEQGIELIAPHRSNRRPENIPNTPVCCTGGSAAARSSGRLPGCSTSGDYAPAERGLPPCSGDSCIWLARFYLSFSQISG